MTNAWYYKIMHGEKINSNSKLDQGFECNREEKFIGMDSHSNCEKPQLFKFCNIKGEYPQLFEKAYITILLLFQLHIG